LRRTEPLQTEPPLINSLRTRLPRQGRRRQDRDRQGFRRTGPPPIKPQRLEGRPERSPSRRLATAGEDFRRWWPRQTTFIKNIFAHGAYQASIFADGDAEKEDIQKRCADLREKVSDSLA